MLSNDYNKKTTIFWEKINRKKCASHCQTRRDRGFFTNEQKKILNNVERVAEKSDLPRRPFKVYLLTSLQKLFSVWMLIFCLSFFNTTLKYFISHLELIIFLTVYKASKK